MRGFNIFLHALRMVFGNFATVLRIGGVALVALVLLYQSIGEAHFAVPTAQTGMPELPSAATVALRLVQIIVGLWVVVAWHRYILLEEEPGALAPRFNGGAVWAYMVAGFFYTLALIAAAIPLAIVVAIAIAVTTTADRAAGGIAALISGALVAIPMVWVAYRLSPVLPAAAIGRQLKLGEAWSATREGGFSFVLLGVLSVAAGWAINLPAGPISEASVPLALVWVALSNWVGLMVGASIITTIYGAYVEKRALNA